MPRTYGRAGVAASIAALLLVVTAGPALAEGDLLIEADAVYELMPIEEHLQVTVEFRLTHNKPGSGWVRYYYDSFSFLLPDEATDIVVVDDNGRSLDFTEEWRELGDDGGESRIITAEFAKNLWYKGTEVFTVAFSLPGGDPRTDSLVRANPAYGAFAVWAWGDPGTSRVDIVIPPEFEVEYAGSPLVTRQRDGITTWYRDGIPDPSNWFVFFTARNDDGLTAEVAEFDDLTITVKAWPGDATWSDRVLDVVERGMPELQRLVGLDFGDQETLDFLEALDPSLVGYAGWYLLDEDVIEIGEDLDDHVVIHEMSHLWFNEDLFDSRWINEGLADEFAVVVVKAIDGESDPAYSRLRPPSTSRSVAVPLNDWAFPYSAPAGDEEVQKREEYGYNAAYYVIRVLRNEIGTDGMIAVLRAAANDHIAYQATGEPETVDPTDDWRRFLDLLEELTFSQKADEVFREYVVDEDELILLDERAEARDAYRSLLDEDGPLATPLVVRQAMSEWDFETAHETIDAALDLLTAYDELVALADTLNLATPTSPMDRYEEATSMATITGARMLVDSQRASLEAVIEAKAALDADRDFLTRIGLRGQDPEADWQAAAAEFEAGSLTGPPAMAADLIALLDDAARVGKIRVIWATAGASGILILLAGGSWYLIRRRRHGRRSEIAVADAA